ncbi:hypothetical protein WA1_51010 [Scytonema hofmannii PCC 7110]|uniref:Uncharacterized protein n=1 Tax=Scytonema hofmannii PCC 7110 TaxID=128403 RepID=A0A139WQ36_9CYAN|nr:hypothetical protein [Scytonema hofmannii]KYC34539.1 hypothetical protein WA1_51010 [Scytonema hofmannii PCC 7110]
MLAKERLARLEETLDIDYEKLDEFEKELVLLASPTQKFELKQRLKREVLPSIRQHESEYLQILSQEANLFHISEQQASQAIVDVVQQVENITTSGYNSYPPEVIELLKEILRKLNELDKPAAAKLKATLPLLPPIVSYEVEIDTETSLRKIRQIITRPFKGSSKKKSTMM